MGLQLQDDAEVVMEPQQPIVVLSPPAALAQPENINLEKIIKNEAKYYKGTTKPDKVEAWILNT